MDKILQAIKQLLESSVQQSLLFTISGPTKLSNTRIAASGLKKKTQKRHHHTKIPST